MHTYLQPLARALVALIFILSGLRKLAAFSATLQMISTVGFPTPALFLLGAVVLEVGGGLALLVGYKTRWAALALIIFLIPATLVFHVAYLGDQAQGQQQMVEVLKNLAIMGGLLRLFIDGAGAFSLDAAWPKRSVTTDTTGTLVRS